jgi:hypothetical protein
MGSTVDESYISCLDRIVLLYFYESLILGPRAEATEERTEVLIILMLSLEVIVEVVIDFYGQLLLPR